MHNRLSLKHQKNQSLQISNDVIFHRHFIKYGVKNFLYSHLLERFVVGGQLILTPSMIAEEVSPALGLDRRTIIRHLVESCGNKDLPHFTIEERGEKRKDRHWVITFKGKKKPKHFYGKISPHGAGVGTPKRSNLERQILSVLAWEQHCLSNNPNHRPLRAKDYARRVGTSLPIVRKIMAKLKKEGKIHHLIIREKYSRKKFLYVRGKRTKVVLKKITRTRSRSVVALVDLDHNSSSAYLHPYHKNLPSTPYKKKKIVRNWGKNPPFANDQIKLSPLLERFLPSWEVYQQKYGAKSDESLQKTIGACLKYKIPVPRAEEVEQALLRPESQKYLKLAHKQGWCAAAQGCLVEKGGVINDQSEQWAKYGANRYKVPNLLWFFKNCRKVNAGSYDERELTAKESRTWEITSKLSHEPTIDTTPRSVKSAQQWKADIQSDIRMSQREKDFRLDLLGKHREYAYDNWFKACGYDADNHCLTHAQAFYRREIERKYALKITPECTQK
jgi:hypothetical protein